MAKKKKSAKESKQPDTLQPSWAVHELCALALTLVLALWVVVKYGKQTQPPALNSARAKERTDKLVELRAADEKELKSFGILDSDNKIYRLPIRNAMTSLVGIYQGESNFTNAVADRLLTPEQLQIKEGKTLFLTKVCFSCHQVDPAVPSPAGALLKAPVFIGDFWGKEREVQLDANPETVGFEPGEFIKVVMDEAYFLESVEKPMLKVVKGAIPGMAPLPTTPEERKALMSYVRSLSKKEEK